MLSLFLSHTFFPECWPDPRGQNNTVLERWAGHHQGKGQRFIVVIFVAVLGVWAIRSVVGVGDMRSVCQCGRYEVIGWHGRDEVTGWFEIPPVSAVAHCGQMKSCEERGRRWGCWLVWNSPSQHRTTLRSDESLWGKGRERWGYWLV